MLPIVLSCLLGLVSAAPVTVAAGSDHASTTAVQVPAPGSRERRALLRVARVPAESGLGKPVQFMVRVLRVSGDWALLHADMREADGTRLGFSDTPLADAARAGGVSNAYMALLRRDEGGWRVVESALGPTDVAWLAWARQHDAPEALFSPQD